MLDISYIPVKNYENLIKNSLEIQVSDEKTIIIVLVINQLSEKNVLTKITCQHGIPLAGCLYDTTTESFHIECNDYLLLDTIPVSFYLKMKEVGNWLQRIPVPEKVIRKYFNKKQKFALKKFKTVYNDCRFVFMQLIDCS